MTSATYYRSPYVVSQLTSSEENTKLESEPLENSDNNVVKKAAVGDKNVSSTEENADKNEGNDLQGAASLQDYSSASNPYSYYPFYIVDEGGKTVERPLINGQGSVSLPGLHLGATIGEGASHGGSAAAAAAAAAAVGGHGNHKPSESGHVEHGGGNGASFAAAGSIAGSFPPLLPLHVRPIHQTVSVHPGQPVHYGGQVHYGGGVPVRPIYSHQGGHYSSAGIHGSSSGIHGIPVQYVGVGGYGSHGSQVHHVGGGSHHGSNGVHSQPVYHVVGNHRPQVHVPVQHVNYRPTSHVRPPYSWSPPHSYHRDLEPFLVISGLPNIHAIGGFNYAEGATSGLGGIHTSQGNPLVISLPVVEGESPGLNNVAQLIQRPFQVIGSILNPQVPEKPHKPTENHHGEHVHKPEQEHAHKPVHEPDHKPVHESAHKPVHESVNKPVHEPVHKPVHETVHKPVHVTVQAVVHKPVETEHKPHYVTAESIHKPQYRPGHNKGEGVSQPTIKPTAGQFSKSNLANGELNIVFALLKQYI